MKKKEVAMLVLGVVGGALFFVGVCMCLMPEWGLRSEGVTAGAAGAVVLMILALVSMTGKPRSDRKTAEKFVTKPGKTVEDAKERLSGGNE